MAFNQKTVPDSLGYPELDDAAAEVILRLWRMNAIGGRYTPEVNFKRGVLGARPHHLIEEAEKALQKQGWLDAYADTIIGRGALVHLKPDSVEPALAFARSHLRADRARLIDLTFRSTDTDDNDPTIAERPVTRAEVITLLADYVPTRLLEHKLSQVRPTTMTGIPAMPSEDVEKMRRDMRSLRDDFDAFQKRLDSALKNVKDAKEQQAQIDKLTKDVEELEGLRERTEGMIAVLDGMRQRWEEREDKKLCAICKRESVGLQPVWYPWGPGKWRQGTPAPACQRHTFPALSLFDLDVRQMLRFSKTAVEQVGKQFLVIGPNEKLVNDFEQYLRKAGATDVITYTPVTNSA